jgi:hypothetical protein
MLLLHCWLLPASKLRRWQQQEDQVLATRTYQYCSAKQQQEAGPAAHTTLLDTGRTPTLLVVRLQQQQQGILCLAPELRVMLPAVVVVVVPGPALLARAALRLAPCRQRCCAALPLALQEGQAAVRQLAAARLLQAAAVSSSSSSSQVVLAHA